MKKRLNILCVLVLMVLGYSVFETAFQMGAGVSLGYEAGRKAGMDEHSGSSGKDLENVANAKVVAVFPDHFPFFTDSVLNEKTGEYVPMMHSQMLVSVKSTPSIWQQSAMWMINSFSAVAILIGIYLFIRLIISINKSDIFNWKNVRRLRWLGASLIISFICTTFPLWMMNRILSESFSMAGYSLRLSDLISITNLVLGLSALIVGEVFAIGLRMKEEQDLTI